MITREQLEAKREQLQASIAQIEATLHAHQGALQMVEALLAECGEDEGPPDL